AQPPPHEPVAVPGAGAAVAGGAEAGAPRGRGQGRSRSHAGRLLRCPDRRRGAGRGRRGGGSLRGVRDHAGRSRARDRQLLAHPRGAAKHRGPGRCGGRRRRARAGSAAARLRRPRLEGAGTAGAGWLRPVPGLMQRSDWSRIAHGDLEFMGPYDETSFGRLLDGAALPAGARVLDLGCGKGALLRWLASRGPTDGAGADLRREPSPIPGVRLVAGDARSFPAEPESFDLVCSVGAVSDIGQLAALARPGGLVLMGEGYWRQPPGDVYLDALGATIDDMLDWQATLAI